MISIPSEWITLGSLVVAVIALLFNRRKDDGQRVADHVRLMTQLESIQTGIDDIRVETRSMREKLAMDSERITACETKIKNLEKEVFRHEQTLD